jgi:hypothetical protein
MEAVGEKRNTVGTNRNALDLLFELDYSVSIVINTTVSISVCAQPLYILEMDISSTKEMLKM